MHPNCMKQGEKSAFLGLTEPEGVVHKKGQDFKLRESGRHLTAFDPQTKHTKDNLHHRTKTAQLTPISPSLGGRVSKALGKEKMWNSKKKRRFKAFDPLI